MQAAALRVCVEIPIKMINTTPVYSVVYSEHRVNVLLQSRALASSSRTAVIIACGILTFYLTISTFAAREVYALLMMENKL